MQKRKYVVTVAFEIDAADSWKARDIIGDELMRMERIEQIPIWEIQDTYLVSSGDE
jgi:hypothetical protein